MIRRLIRYLLRRSRTEAELDEELRAHLAIERQRRIESGDSFEAARTAALQDFGNVLMVKEVTREMWGWIWLENLAQDLRHGFRLLRLNPGFTLVVVLSLGLGIGANTAIFQLLDAVRLRSLPLPRPHELAEIRIAGGNGGMGLNPGRYAHITRPMFEEMRRQQKAFTGLMAWSQNDFRLGKGNDRRRAKGLEVSGEFFQVLGISPWRGRLFEPRDESLPCPAAKPATQIVISYSFWQRELGGQELGPDTKIVAEDQLYNVIGVTPPYFHGVAVGETFDAAIPFCRPEKEPRRDRFGYNVIGRLRPGWTIEKASAHLAALSPGIMEATEIQGYGSDTVARYRKFRLTADSAHNGVSALRNDYDSSLWLLLGMTGLVLLIACANLANLMLARSSAREREIALRLSLGASRGRLLRQFTAESALMALIGVILGVALAQTLGRVLVASLSTQSESIYLPLNLDWRVLLFASAVGAVTCIVFGLIPARRVTRMQPDAVLRSGGRGLTASRERFSMQQVMVVTQIAVSLVLVAGALLFVRSFRNLMTFDPGMRQKGITIAFAGLPAKMPDDRLEGFQRELLEEVAAAPGVREAGSTTNVPLLGSSWGHGIDIGANHRGATFTWVSPAYFAAMGIPVIAGRGFDNRDTGSSKRVAIVNQAFVKRFCGTADPLGQTMRTGAEPGYPSTVYEIVGVVPDTSYSGLRETVPPSVFAPGLQFPRLGPWATIMIHADTPHAATVAAVKARLLQKFPAMIVEFQNFRGSIEDGLLRERLMAILSGFFGALAVLLATVGLYGVVSYVVARRKNEIGIRVALGARSGQVIRMVMADMMRLLAPGLAIGIALSLVATQGARSLLFGIRPYDPFTLAGAGAFLAMVAVGASFLPARRAANLDPLAALRHE
jgi:predicted permease